MNGETLQLVTKEEIENSISFANEPWRKSKRFQAGSYYAKHGKSYKPIGALKQSEANEKGLTKTFLLKVYNRRDECIHIQKIWSTGKKAAMIFFKTEFPHLNKSEYKTWIHKNV